MAPKTEDMSLDALMEPFFVDSTKADEECTLLEKSCKDFYENHSAEGKTRTTEALQAMRRDSNNTNFGTIDVSSPIKVHASGGADEVIKATAAIRAVVSAYFTCTVTTSLLADPFVGHPRFLVGIQGQSFVIVISKKELLKHNNEVSRAVAALGDYESFPSFIVQSGQAVWIPAGHAPIIATLPPVIDWTSKEELKLPAFKSRAGATQRRHGSIAHMFFHDEKLVKAYFNASERLNMASSWVRSSQYFPDSFTKADAFQKFKSFLDATEAAIDVAPP